MTSTGILLTGERVWYKVILRFISFLFKSIWLFFPAILFVVLAVWCFWMLGQGKDIIVAFGENPRAKIYFFLAIALWVYLSWFSSRVVAYQKLFKQLKNGGFKSDFDYEQYERTAKIFSYELPLPWLEIFPRVLGFACFLVIELALLQLKFYGTPGWSTPDAVMLFLALLFLYLALNNKLSEFTDENKKLTRILFFSLLALFVVLVLVVWMIAVRNLMLFFWLVVLLHIVYVVYIHFRRTEIKDASLQQTISEEEHNPLRRALYWLMDLLHIPRVESGYFLWFILVAITGIAVYVLAIVKLPIAVNIGPFPLVLLAFSVLLGFGNIVTIVSVRSGVNWHVLIFLFALLLGSKETHYVRMSEQSKDRVNIYKQRQGMIDYFNNWIKDSARGNLIDSSSKSYNVYFVLANGGASRSGYWTAAVLGKLEDATRGTKGWFSQHLFCLSGASGGSVGNATFFAMLDSSRKLTLQNKPTASFTKGASTYLGNDFLSYTLARMLGPDYFKYIFHFTWADRAGALENSLEDIKSPDTSLLLPNMKTSVASVLALKQQQYKLPIFCINVTRMQDGNPGVVSNVKLDSLNFNNRVDVLELMPDDKDISLGTAAILGARFPYVSPAGRIDEEITKDSLRPHYFVDGGYFDNSGAGIVQEMIRLINNYVRTSNDPVIKSRAAKLRYVILHITNGPVGGSILNPVSPLTNDMAAPLLTIVGAYDMQTTVNDQRLRNFLKDVDSMGPAKAAYYPIHLYKEYFERELDSTTGKRKKEDPYPMNWFISDTMRHRMDARLISNPRLNNLIQGILSQASH
jgi:hypothetical protein